MSSYSHGLRKFVQSFVEIVHLGQNADDTDNDEDICRRMRELIEAAESQLQRNAECLDSHDGDGSSGGADGEIVEGAGLAIFRGNSVDHEDGDDC